MKKMLTLSITLFLSFAVFLTVSAGSLPEDLLCEENAKVFIGTVVSYTTKEIPSAPYIIVDSVQVIPLEKIKGDVKIGETIDFNCDPIREPKLDTEYVFGAFDNTCCCMFEIEAKTDGKIKLKNAGRLENMDKFENRINDGTFARHEQERLRKLAENQAASQSNQFFSHTIWYMTGVTFLFLLILAAGHLAHRKKYKNQ